MLKELQDDLGYDLPVHGDLTDVGTARRSTIKYGADCERRRG